MAKVLSLKICPRAWELYIEVIGVMTPALLRDVDAALRDMKDVISACTAPCVCVSFETNCSPRLNDAIIKRLALMSLTDRQKIKIRFLS